MKKPEGKFAWTVKVGEKGQFVIPKEARDVFDIKPLLKTKDLIYKNGNIFVNPSKLYVMNEILLKLI